MSKIKAVGLLSGGLDSILAIKVLQNQKIEVAAVHFVSPFFDKSDWCRKIARQFKFPLKKIILGEDYLKLLQCPPHGYGGALNPCIDCHILMLKKAKAYAKKIGATFVFTGEVLGERPMSQNRRSLDLIEKESGLQGKLLRPLSAKLLPVTEAERDKLVAREKLMDIEGRSRKKQMALAQKFGIENYPTPSGGCLLTEKGFCKKLSDLFKYKKRISQQDLELLKIGRHFRLGSNKIIVGKNEAENQKLMKLKRPKDYVLRARKIPSPTTLLQGRKTKKVIGIAAQLTARYSDFKDKKIKVEYGKKDFGKVILVSPVSDLILEKLRIV